MCDKKEFSTFALWAFDDDFWSEWFYFLSFRVFFKKINV
ncbi:hypothetical protein THERMOS_315 [Bathymodiolus thermophilus thioautotrophic gill symbiont]|uniref:Uncharacterized protein n=1 Tax=Bathymodiolus thermophilus thioautotrophic gill symbiont TaxID=2360 RepID=A0A8H9CFA1_9GAMM|nr:hypothetical protein THERMOS_315 [Bathymodiolus thermophilus thioautotrophic gill symbiont]